MDWPALLALIVAVVIPVGLAVHAAGRARSEKNAKQLEDHGERLARLETKVEQHEQEIKSLRDRWHDFRDITLRKVWEMFGNKDG